MGEDVKKEAKAGRATGPFDGSRNARRPTEMRDYCPFCMAPARGDEPCPTCGYKLDSCLAPPHHLPFSTLLLNRYLMGRALGSSGLTITYVGRDLALDTKVVVKELFPIDLVSRRSAESYGVTPYSGVGKEDLENCRAVFLHDARTLASLGKNEVLSGARDFFEENGTAYIVTDYIDGESLSQVTAHRGGRIECDELLDLARPLFPALSELHGAGLIHGNISPENVLLTGGGVRLVGCSCPAAPTVRAHASVMPPMTVYSPIERHVGRRQGPWTDVYSLCASLYACVTGIEPPPALNRVAKDGMAPPRDLGIRMSTRQEAALMRGLRMMPSGRFTTMSQLEAALYAHGRAR